MIARMNFAHYMISKGISDEEMAARIGDGASKSFVRKLRLGDRRPSLARAIAIARATRGKVGLMDWDTERERGKRQGGPDERLAAAE
jgi:transcriptional regulator with XRE-family HTH domain